MKQPSIHSYLKLIALSIFLSVIQGCSLLGGGDANTQVEYANPTYKHVKDLPVNRFKDTADSPEDSNQKPESAASLQQTGDRMLSKGNYFLAYMNYQKALKLEPGNTVLEFKTALTFLVAHKNKEAIKAFKSLVAKEPRFVQAYEGLGIAFFREGQYDESENYFRKTLELDPANWKSHNFMGAIFDSRHEYQKAANEYEAALKINPGAGFVFNNLGVSFTSAGDYQKAVMAFEMATQLNYRSEKVYNNLGLALVQLGRYDEALDNYRKGGSESCAYNNLGCGYLRQGKFRDAIACFEKAIDIDPSYYVIAGDNLRKAEKALRTEHSTTGNRATVD